MAAKLDLILGSALWGWTVPRERCFALLDSFYAAGYRAIDCATNYPIDKEPDHFRLAEDILAEWILANNISDLRLIMKVGSLDNNGTPDNNLHNSFFLMSYDYYRTKFGENLDTIMVHWDNRDDISEIEWSVRALETIRHNGTRPGLSGISAPELYAQLLGENGSHYLIQCKHNIFQSAYQHYAPFHNKSQFIVYGINAGGLKLNAAYSEASSASVRGVSVEQYKNTLASLRQVAEGLAAPLQQEASFNHIALLNAYHTAGISGVIVGTSRVSQLEETVQLTKWLSDNDSSQAMQKVKELLATEGSK